MGRIIPFVLGLVAVAACAAPAPETRGARAFSEMCAVCHGADARGGGPLAADLPVPPADLTGLAARNGGAFPAEDVMAQIHGYPGRYHQAIMPEFGPLLGPAMVPWRAPSGEIVETPRALLDLSAYLESLQR
ncbi:cytochrome c [Thalassococcus sp. CAU 1522]|uniref:Cytochrome c n=1 Tax=Thalassococcus arenae TaxID=2851652 RepID=A0ABS6N4U9_9RHOB|nr:cytochrome c [Thalassococcus arenae]MBV2358575.1 cytochrome c [Thalassococcus arenae]